MILFVYLSGKQVIPLSETGQGKKSAIFIPVGPDLSGKGNNTMVFSFVFYDAGQGRFYVRILDQQTHAAAEFSLNGAGCRGDAIFDTVFQQQIPQRQTLLIVNKQDIPPKV